MKQLGKGLILRLAEHGGDVVLLGVISDVHLDKFFPRYVLRALLQRLQQFELAVKDMGQNGSGILVILGDFIDLLTLNGVFPGQVPVIMEVMRHLRRLQNSGIMVIILKGNHDRWLFAEKSLSGWWSTVLQPNYRLAEWLFLEDPWLRVLFDHGHRWDITNREIFDQGRPIKSLGDLVVERLVVPLQMRCPDLNRVEPLYHIPLYLQQRDQSGSLLRTWLEEFKKLMKSADFKKWRRCALPRAQRILTSMLPLFYQVYETLGDTSAPGLAEAVNRISEFDRTAGDYLSKRQRELLAGKLETENYPQDWESFVTGVRYIVNGHSHRAELRVKPASDGNWSGRISTGAWVKRLELFPDVSPTLSLAHFQLTWTEMVISVSERRILEIKQESPNSLIL